MTDIVWIADAIVLAIHEALLAEHGGLVGLRDRGLLESALRRPQQLATYTQPDLADLAAAYGFGIVRNHPFLDGNKRVAFTLTELFLTLNGHTLTADDTACVVTMLQLAEGQLPEQDFAAWIRAHSHPSRSSAG